MWHTFRRRGPVNSLIVAGLIVLCGLAECCGCKIPPEDARILDLPSGQAKVEFVNLPLDKQVEVYRYAVCQEPPSEEYADYLAANGKTIIPVVLEKLEARPDQLRKAPLVLVLLVLHKKYYRLGDQADLIARLNADAASIQDPSDRREAEDYLRRMESSPGVGAK